MGSNSILYDGDYSRPFAQGSARAVYPFQQFGDRVTKGFEQDYWQFESTYVPPLLGTQFHRDPTLFVCAASSPVQILGDLIQFTLTWTRVPPNEISYTSQPITKPVFPTNDFDAYWSDSITSTPANVWSPTLAATVGLYPTGGTFTLTYKASTTGALNWNDSNATIQTALNALASAIADTVTFTVANTISAGYIVVSRATGSTNWATSDMSINLAGLTPASIGAITQSIANSWDQRIARTAMTFNRTAHGLIAGQAIRINTTTTGGGTQTTVLAVTDADNFTVTNANANPSTWAYYRTYVRSYTPGNDRIGVRLTQKFYLPGVTTGIASPTSIPIPDPLLNDTNFLIAAITYSSGYQTYDSSDLGFWGNTIIYTQTLREINMADI